MSNFKVGDVVKPTKEIKQEDKFLCHLVSGKVSLIFEEFPEHIFLSDCTWDDQWCKNSLQEPFPARKEWFTLAKRRGHDEELHFMLQKDTEEVRFVHNVNGKVAGNRLFSLGDTPHDGYYDTCIGIINSLKEDSPTEEEEEHFCALPYNIIRVGDIVRVVDDGEAYSTYSSWFKENGCEQLQYRYLFGVRFFCHALGYDDSTKFRVIAVSKEQNPFGGYIYAIEQLDDNQGEKEPVFLINERGIVLYDPV